ncbi:hypothetical protein SDRG_05518 [Saprolegnia diclina VS20]|uniref:Calpain catalytic domain-containing protein n=1 Tax=Saprolegnia diclina (strain VS20) TaxID=1156394 RepID=T0QRC4_SAPDV|nr:hypothetical protein SDRG_05518 [Saprolegnia diclina VS20]EQC37296.1 hypothetical protein SDRG_05518 [Saprolegnia diclina VS20]|eukprot:XP_008609458.1 hypothetical protein SDRG_05518 [Saprolegnia diclina VS20]
MPPKKPAPAGAAKGRDDDGGCPVMTASERERLPPRNVPENVPALATLHDVPKVGFLEWTENLEMENWYSPANLYEDPMGLPPLPPHIDTSSLVWKRPSQYLPPLPEPPKQVAKAVAVDPKSSGKKSAQAKKVDDKVLDDAKVQRYCYVLYDPLLDPVLAKPGDASGTTTPAGFRAEREWKYDFQRLWSAEQAHDISRWEAEEARILADNELRERLSMEYEENWQIKYLKVLAVQKQAADADLNDDDIMDDGDDGDAAVFEASASPTPMSIIDLFGPPPMMDIEPNRAVRPTVPEGEYVDPPLASCCRVINNLVDRLVTNQPYYWEHIYPQSIVGGKKVPVANPGGKYLVKLYVLGKWRRVEVDDRLPLDKNGKVIVLSSTLPTEIWPSLLAKAIYKVFAWLGSLPNMNSPSTTTLSIGFILNALTTWKSRPYVTLSDAKAQDELVKVTPLLDAALNVEVQPSLSLSNVVLVCPLASVMTRSFNAVCGEAFVLASIRSIHPSYSVYIYSSRLDAAPDETLGFTPETLEYHKMTSMILHTIPTHTLQLVQEWRQVVSPTDVTVFTWAPFPHDLPHFLIVNVPSDVVATTLYVTLQTAPVADSSVTDRGLLLLEDPQLSLAKRNDSTNVAPFFKPFVSLPFEVHGPGTHVFRLYPQTLGAGYSLEIESDVVVALQSMPECVTTTCGMHTEVFEGEYIAMPADAWHIVHKSTIAIAPSTSAKRRLIVHVHLMDEAAGALFHLHIVNNTTREVTRYHLLEAHIDLGDDSTHAFTVLLECVAQRAVPPAKYTILIASDGPISSGPLVNAPLALSMFAGVYTPNKYHTLFRDVFVPHGADDAKKGAAPIAVDACFKLSSSVPEAALKLEIFDAVSGASLAKASDYDCVQIMQLPPHADGYIVEGSFDTTKWLVPAELQSVKPFADLGRPPEPTTVEAARWSLEVFASGPASLTPDCTTLNKHAAIRFGWEQAERGREVRGIISRLLYLGKHDEAIEKMNEAEYTPEQQKQMLGRYETTSTSSVEVVPSSGHDRLLTRDEWMAEAEARQVEIESLRAQVEMGNKARADASVQRKAEIDAMKKDIMDLRQAWLVERERLWNQREALRKEQPNPTPVANFP